jgi:hypothetical protein
MLNFYKMSRKPISKQPIVNLQKSAEGVEAEEKNKKIKIEIKVSIRINSAFYFI